MQRDQQNEIILRLARQSSIEVRRHSYAWSIIGGTLVDTRSYREAYQWIQSWRDHANIEPWMLFHVTEALRAVGKDREAEEVNKKAIELDGYGQHIHHIVLAFVAACNGDVAAARMHLQSCERETPESYFGFYKMLGECLLELREATPDQRPSRFWSIAARVKAVKRHREGFRDEPGFRRAFLRCAREITKLTDTASAWLWYGWQLLTVSSRPASAKS